MPIKKYIANKDTTITNAYKLDLIHRAEDANMGASDSLEMFSIFAQANTSSVEKSRILVQFPVSDVIQDRNNSKLPISGSVRFVLKMYNVKHPFSLPKDYIALIAPLSQSWDEGYGLDMESYSDYGWSINNKGQGSTWKYRESGSVWATEGADFYTVSSMIYTASFPEGTEDIEIDVTDTVESWVSGTLSNYGFIIKLSGAFEDGTENRSFYTKKFSARGSEFFYKRPSIEARWEAVVVDDRNNFFASSSALSAQDNTMNLYFYNKVNGRMKNIVGNVVPNIKFYSDALLTNEVSSSYSLVTNPVSGTYKASVAIDTTASVLYDKWFSGSNTYFSGSFDVIGRVNYDYNSDDEYIVNITNLRNKYAANEAARFNIFSRKKDWQPTIYSVAYNTIENSIIPDLYYKIFRLNDNYVVLDYSTGSLAYTKTSYDSNGNYFDLDMSIIEKNYVYGIKFARWDGIELKELPTTFKFKVE